MSEKSVFKKIFIGFFLSAWLSLAVSPQTVTGSLVGHVEDSNGSAFPARGAAHRAN